jgi:diguanylate cyclase (GGDEF)-like protein/PAS domain S-box-containing protein
MSIRAVCLVILLAAAYALAGRMGLAIPSIGSSITLFWPPTGIAVAALFVCGLRFWPGVALGALLVNLWIGAPLATAMAIAIGNTLGPVAVVAMLRRGGFQRTFDRPRHVMLYGAAVAAGMTLPALGGVVSLYASGAIPSESFGDAWLMWWLGDSVGALIVGPVLLAFTREKLQMIRSRPGEAAALVVVALACAWLIFSFTPKPSASDPPYAFLSIAPLVWAAFRFGPLGASTIALLFSTVGAWATVTGHGQFRLDDVREGLFLQWAYMATIGGIGLMITAMQAERTRAIEGLAQSRTMLDAIRRGQTQLIVDMDSGRTLDDLLGALASVTRSAFVFIAEIPRERDGRPNGSTCEITNAVFASDQAKEAYPGTLVGTALPTLLAAARDGAQSIEVGRRQNLLGEWLPLETPVSTFLALPLLQGGEPIGVVGLANRDGGYDAGMPALLEPFATTIASIIGFREAKEMRRLDEQRLNLALTSGEMALFDWNVDTGEVLLNEQWSMMLGEPPARTRTTFAALTALVHPDDLESLREPLRAVLKGAASYRVEHRVRSPAGRWIWIKSDGQVVQRDAKGRALRVIGTNQPIDTRKLAEQALRASEEKFARAFQLSPMLMAISTVADGRYVDVNDTYERVTGYCRDEVIGRSGLDVALWVDSRERDRVLAAVARDGRVRDCEVRLRKKCGEVMFCEVSCEPLVLNGIPCMLSVTTDITQRKRDEVQMRLASKVLETTADAVVLSDAEDRVIMVNPSFSKMTGFTPDEMLGKVLSESPFRPIDPEQSEARMEIQRRQGYLTAEVIRHRKDGSELPLWVTASNVCDDSGEIINFVRVFTDISQLKASQRQLEALASHDALTGLLNRRVFDDRLEHALRRTARTGEDLTLLFIDLDGFKRINDTYGHDAGDLCLQTVAVRLRACIRSGDSLCRFGGDEFAVILEGGDAASARRVGQRIVEECGRPLSIGDRTLCLSASVGVAIRGCDGEDATSLLKSADLAMYAGKRAGGGTVRLHTTKLQVAEDATVSGT